jgi:hypothetical protein
MSNEITPANPEAISDEQLEEVSGGGALGFTPCGKSLPLIIRWLISCGG